MPAHAWNLKHADWYCANCKQTVGLSWECRIYIDNTRMYISKCQTWCDAFNAIVLPSAHTRLTQIRTPIHCGFWENNYDQLATVKPLFSQLKKKKKPKHYSLTHNILIFIQFIPCSKFTKLPFEWNPVCAKVNRWCRRPATANNRRSFCRLRVRAIMPLAWILRPSRPFCNGNGCWNATNSLGLGKFCLFRRRHQNYNWIW